jgi:hypothetical protein
MKVPLLIAPILVGCLFPASSNMQAPGPQDFRKLYGEPAMERFTARDGITVTVEYGPDRLACQLLIEPQQVLTEVRNQGPAMSSEAILETLEQVVPASTRGKQISVDNVQIEGDRLLRTDYENVSIRRVCTVYACGPSPENRDLRTLVVFNRELCPKHLK